MRAPAKAGDIAAARAPYPKTAAPSAPAPLASATVQHLTVSEAGEAQRLDNYLVKTLKGAPKSLIYRIIRSGEVRVNKGRASAETRLNVGDDIRVPPLRLTSRLDSNPAPAREFPILFEDACMLVINKPAGVAVHGGSGVSHGVIEQLRQSRPQAAFLELVHRLDKETSGILVIAKKRSALIKLQEEFRQRTAHKSYAALVFGQWPQRLKVIDAALHKFLTAEGERRVKVVQGEDEGRRAISLVKVMARFDGYSLLQVTIKTGRTHQIRVHLASQGHGIVGDEKYGDFSLNKSLARPGAPGAASLGPSAVRFERMFLHASSLQLQHPQTGEPLQFEAPLPPVCTDFLAQLAVLPASQAGTGTEPSQD